MVILTVILNFVGLSVLPEERTNAGINFSTTKRGVASWRSKVIAFGK